MVKTYIEHTTRRQVNSHNGHKEQKAGAQGAGHGMGTAKAAGHQEGVV